MLPEVFEYAEMRPITMTSLNHVTMTSSNVRPFDFYLSLVLVQRMHMRFAFSHTGTNSGNFDLVYKTFPFERLILTSIKLLSSLMRVNL